MSPARPDARYQSPGPWVAQAACADATAAMTMPLGSGRGQLERTRAHVAAARDICRACPVARPCKDWALSEPDPAYGMVAGGLTPAERAELRASAERRISA